MQDRFKFRVWDETEKNMVYFDGIFYNKKPYTECSSFPQYESSPHYHKLSDLMQSTGLKDKNGKLIYEGDIVDIWKMAGNIHKRMIVKWYKPQCSFRLFNLSAMGATPQKFFDKRSLGAVTSIKIIGNIYENPELLEV